MTRLDDHFTQLRDRGRKALVIYLTASDPSLDVSVEAAIAASEAGADVLEVGVPFSDPVADGPAIQRAMERALAAGGGFDAALTVVERVRAKVTTPVVLFGYLNPLLYHGEAALRRARDAGVDGVLVVDVPVEESQSLRTAAAELDLNWIGLATPTSGHARITTIAAASTGFVYVVSMTGVTGGALVDLAPVRAMVADIRHVGSIPACVGFGVRDRGGARGVAAVADGVVVGSAAVSALHNGHERGDGVAALADLVRELRAGVDDAIQEQR